MRTAARRGAFALAAGLLLFAGHPPLDQGWAGLVALVPLLLLARDAAASPRPLRTAAAWGFVAGVVFFFPLLTWIGRFGLVAWVLLTVVQALFVAAFTAGVAAWGERPAWPVAAVVWWIALEAARTRWPLGGFPWGVLGYTQHNGGLLLPVARTLGVLGVSAAAAAIAAAAAAAVERFARTWDPQALQRPALAGLAVLAGAVLLGVEAPAPTGDTVDIAAVQGNDLELPPVVDRDDAARVERVAERMLAATRALTDDPPEVTVWPENALDADPDADDDVGRVVTRALDALGGRPLLAGALLDGPRPRTFLNAIVEFAADGEIVQAYVKRKLVPFGEYVPWRAALGDFPPLRQIPSDGVPGDEAAVFDIAGAHIGPVTCYESIFPDLVRSQVRAGADVLLVSTNNASFGRTPASRQHLAFSQLRAVESGRWVLHAGISGISAVIDPDGGVSQRTELFEQAIVRAQLPLIAADTPATRIADAVAAAALGLGAAGVAWLVVSAVRTRVQERARRRRTP
jgi:apolipoprotein N-acyltransferase